MKKNTKISISVLLVSAIVVLLVHCAFLWILPQNDAGDIFNPNPTGSHVTVGAWQNASYGPYETRKIITRNYFYTIYGDQKRELKPNAPIIGDTTFMHSELNKSRVAIAIVISILVTWFVLWFMMKDLFLVNTGRGFPVKTEG